MTKIFYFGVCFFLAISFLAGCSEKSRDSDQNQTTETENKPTKPAENNKTDQDQNAENKTEPNQNEQPAPSKALPDANDGSIKVISQPATISVLVNKQFKLPEEYTPSDLAATTIPFVSYASDEKRKMRSEAANAIAGLFEGAIQQGVQLLGVSAYRSHQTQVALFNYYVERDGYEKARTYSAVPGTSEHETGLSIDVTGGDGKCAAEDCFANTPEAKWLQEHAAEYGFIIRYPNGKEAITGYQYEPWHLRYVGTAIAKEIMSRGITLEEYYNAAPVNK